MINLSDLKIDNTHRVDRIKICTDAGMSITDATIAHDAAVEAVHAAFAAAQASMAAMPEGVIKDAAQALTLKMLEANAHVMQAINLEDSIEQLFRRMFRR